MTQALPVFGTVFAAPSASWLARLDGVVMSVLVAGGLAALILGILGALRPQPRPVPVPVRHDRDKRRR